jgi:dolichol-phosphate mannosyltransferase
MVSTVTVQKMMVTKGRLDLRPRIAPHLYIILPCFNEGNNLPRLFKRFAERIKNVGYTLMVVNDGSTDDTLNVLRNLEETHPLEVVQHGTNLGLSEALRSGLSLVLSQARDEDIVTTMDGDDTHNPIYLDAMMNEIKKGADIVIASRYVNGGVQLSVPLSRRLLSRSVNAIIGLVSSWSIKDATSGYRCFRASVLKDVQRKFGQVPRESEGFEGPLEILYRAVACSQRVVEIPFSLEYNNKDGKSKMNVPLTIMLYVKLLFRIVLWRLNAKCRFL